MQKRLESIYEIAVQHDIDDFLVTDHALISALDNSLPYSREKLLVAQDADNLDIALYLDADLVSRLHIDDPTIFLHDGNLSDFWTALEGVSHFIYLSWNAGYHKAVTQLELELQAEVDKYIITAGLIVQQKQLQCLPHLHTTLFSDIDFHASMDAELTQRYMQANHYAGKYCHALEKYYIHDNRVGLLNELRKFYRMPYQDKIKRIQSFLH